MEGNWSSKTRQLIVLAIAIGIFVLNCSDKKQSFYWRMQSQATSTSPDFKALQVLAKRLETMSNGRFIIDVFPDGEVVAGPDIFRAVKVGEIEMGNGWPNWWSSQHPAWAVMNAGPFDFMNLDASMMFFLAGPGTDLANELSAPHGIVWRPAWWPGMEFGLLSSAPIHGLDDLKDKIVRIGPGLPAEVLAEASGATTIPLVPSEIRPALESGQIDAVEWTTASGVWDLQLHQVAQHALVPAIWQPSVLSDFLINAEAYEALPDDLKTMLETAMKAYSLEATFQGKLADIDSFEKFLDSQIEVRTWSVEDIDRWREANAKIIENYRGADDFSRKFIDEKQNFKKRYNAYGSYFAPYE